MTPYQKCIRGYRVHHSDLLSRPSRCTPLLAEAKGKMKIGHSPHNTSEFTGLGQDREGEGIRLPSRLSAESKVHR